MCKLETNDGVIDELLPKCLSLVGIFDTFLEADSRKSQALNDDTNTFVCPQVSKMKNRCSLRLTIEVGHDDLETLVLFADQVLNWYFDIFKSNVSCT